MSWPSEKLVKWCCSMKLLNCTSPSSLLALAATLQMLRLLSIHMQVTASEQTIEADDGAAPLPFNWDLKMHQKVSDLSVDDDKSAPVKKGKLRKAWQYVGGAGNAAKVLLQALFSVTAAVSIWQQVSLSIQETLNLMGWSNKTSGNNNMLEEYISKLQNKSKLAEKPSPDPTTEEPVFAFFRNNFIASCLIFVIVNIALIMFMWRTSKERALKRQLRAQQMQDIIVVAGGADKRRSKKRRRRKRKRKKNDT